MPVSINDIVVMTDDGKLTEDFTPSMLGDEYNDTKSFEGTTDLVTIMKRFVDNHAAIGKKLENVIQKPGENATDQEKAEYEVLLKEALGAGKSLEDYVLGDNGVPRDEAFTKFLQQAFLDEGLSPAVAKRLVEKLDKGYLEKQALVASADQQTYDDEVKAYKATHLGPKLITGPRIALKAMLQFAAEVDPELAKAIVENKVLEDPGNFELLKKIGVGPSQLRIWEPIGEAMKSDMAITNEGKPTNADNNLPEKGTQEAVIHETYNHETSKADRAARGKKY